MSGGSSHRAPPPPPRRDAPPGAAPQPRETGGQLTEIARHAARLQAKAARPAPIADFSFAAPMSAPSPALGPSWPSMPPSALGPRARPRSLVPSIVTASLASIVIGAALTLAIQDFQRNEQRAPLLTRVPAVAAAAAPAAAPAPAFSRSGSAAPNTELAALSFPATGGGDELRSEAIPRPAVVVEAAPVAAARAASFSKPARAEPEPPAAPAAAAPPTIENREAAPAAFDREAASAALAKARASAQACGDGSTEGSTRVAVTFAPSGRVTTAVLEGDSRFLGSAIGGCIARHMRAARVPAFEGQYVTVHTTVRLAGPTQ